MGNFLEDAGRLTVGTGNQTKNFWVSNNLVVAKKLSISNSTQARRVAAFSKKNATEKGVRFNISASIRTLAPRDSASLPKGYGFEPLPAHEGDTSYLIVSHFG